MNKVKNKLRVLHYPQVPCTPFFVDEEEGMEFDEFAETYLKQQP